MSTLVLKQKADAWKQRRFCKKRRPFPQTFAHVSDIWKQNVRPYWCDDRWQILDIKSVYIWDWKVNCLEPFSWRDNKTSFTRWKKNKQNDAQVLHGWCEIRDTGIFLVLVFACKIRNQENQLWINLVLVLGCKWKWKKFCQEFPSSIQKFHCRRNRAHKLSCVDSLFVGAARFGSAIWQPLSWGLMRWLFSRNFADKLYSLHAGLQYQEK